MDLDELWTWKTRRLACRLRVETGNAAGDDLRERFAELAKVDLKEILADMKATKKKREASNKLAVDNEADAIFKNLEGRSHILGATAKTLQEMQEYDEGHQESFNQKNINKVYTLLPKSPSKRLLQEIQRERAKPLKLPNQDGVSQAQLKLQRKMAKERALKKAEMEGALIQMNDMKENDNLNSLKKPLNALFEPYEGDYFGSGGDYMNSMLYLSRTADAVIKTRRYNAPIDEIVQEKSFVNSDSKDSAGFDKSNDNKKGGKEESSVHDVLEQTLSSVDVNSSKENDSKLYCAICLCDWSRDPLNSHRLADEGAIKAISQLIQDPNLKIVYFSSAAFSYMAEQAPLAAKMIDEGVISIIGEMIQIHSLDEFIMSNLTMTMVNLTRHGHEAALVEGGIIMAFLNMIGVRPELGMLCTRGLYNLTCVDQSYHNIERLIRALVSISSTNSMREKHIIAASLCNLSDLKAVRPRLVEEGVINTLGVLAKGGEPRTRRICAIILQNLSASKGIRVEIVSRNGISVAYALSSDEDSIVLRAIALTLSRLTKDAVNASRIIAENGITAVTNITILSPKAANVTQPLAICFRYLTQHPMCRANLVGEAGGVGAIGVVLRNSVDNATIQNVLIALSNLLIDHESHTSILQQGILPCLIEISKRENAAIKDIITLVILQFSASEKSQKPLVTSKIPRLICDLMPHLQSIVSKRRCAIALCRLSCYEAGIQILVDQEVISALKVLLDTQDTVTIHSACVALCRICCNEANCIKILEADIIVSLVGASAIDVETNQYCLAVLSMLSYYECSRTSLIENGIMSVLKNSAQIHDDLTNQRCLLTYANLSCEPSAQERMVEDGVIKVASLLAESYHEINYVCCAKVMCNLACNKTVCDKIAKQGGVYALLIISIVHSVDNETKLLCVMALNNLLREESVDTLLQEGIISAMVHLSRIEDQRIVLICAKILNQLSLYPNGRSKLVEKAVNIHIIMDIANNHGNLESQIIASKTACNMVLDPSVRSQALEYGLIAALEKGIEINDESTTMLILEAVYSTCSDERQLKLIAAGTLPSYISIAGVENQGNDVFLLSVNILEELALSKVSRAYLQNAATAGPIIRLITKDLHKDSITSIIKIIRLIVNGYRSHAELIDLGLLQAILTIYTMTDDEGLLLISQIYRIICSSDDCVEKLANIQTIEVMIALCSRLETNSNAMCNLAIILLAIQRGPNECQYKILLPSIVTIVFKAGNHKACHEYVLAFLGLALSDVRSRPLYLVHESVSFVYDTMLFPMSDNTAFNCTRVIFYLSTNSAIRSLLVSPEFHFDRTVSKLHLSSTSLKVKNSCNITCKKLSSDSGGTIEEGIVSQIIHNALDHNKKKKDDESIMIPAIPLLTGSFIWTGQKPLGYDGRESMWSCDFPTLVGGAAAIGPEPPSQPHYEPDNTEQIYTHLTEELEVDTESKSKMAFAKMAIPVDFRAKQSFTDKQFMQARASQENDGTGELTPEDSLLLTPPLGSVRKGDEDDLKANELAGGSLHELGASDANSNSVTNSSKGKDPNRRRARTASGSGIDAVGRKNSKDRLKEATAAASAAAAAPIPIPSSRDRVKSASAKSEKRHEGIASDLLAAKLSLYN